MRVALLTAKPNFLRKIHGQKLSVTEKRPPNGIGYLYAILKQAGFEVDLFDRYCGDTRWPKDNWASYDFLGLYTTTICTTDIQRILRKARAKRIAVGGPHATLFPEQISDRAHHIVRGEAENIIVDLVKGNIDQRMITTDRLSSADLDRLPRFLYETFFGEHHDLYDWGFQYNGIVPAFTMSTSRGCPFDCSFCSVRKIWGRKITYMSVERVLDDIEHIKSLGGRAIYFREDIFTAKRRRLRELCEELIRRDVSINWACESRVDTVSAETMALMKRAGCVGMFVGVEHLSQRMLDIFNKRVKVQQILDFFENAHRHELFVHASFIVDHPDELDEDRAERERLLEVIRPSASSFNKFRADG
jgi:radical SAM superfamily enzyme YgiQ (UPF0313 family)